MFTQSTVIQKNITPTFKAKHRRIVYVRRTRISTSTPLSENNAEIFLSTSSRLNSEKCFPRETNIGTASPASLRALMSLVSSMFC